MSIQTITASAPGKIHFIGEHTAVYFKPAMLAAIDKRCTVSLTPADTDFIEITSKNLKTSVKITASEILTIRDAAQKQWEKYRETNDLSILKSIVKEDSMYPVLAIGETLRHFKIDLQKGFHLDIDSQIPMGSGHGSSAAVAASVVGAVSSFLRRQESRSIKDASLMTSLDTIGSIAIEVEQKKHGNPSYGDVATVINGGLIWFQKKTPEKIIVKPLDFSVPESIAQNLIVIQSGVPEESTGEMVHSVSEFRKLHHETFEKILNHQERLTSELLDVFKNENDGSLKAILKDAENNLETIGIVSESAKKLIRTIEKTGGAAKVCGAGGKSKGSGIILAYHTDKNAIETVAKENRLDYYSVQLGGEGLTIQ